jgi:hypothetical protein
MNPIQRAIQNLRLVERLIDAGYKGLAKELHPDKGGTADQMASLHRVRERLMNAAASMSHGPAFEVEVARAVARADRRRAKTKGAQR